MHWGLTGQSARDTIEADFRALPLAPTAHAAIDAAQSLGAGHVDVRVSRQRSRSASVRDAHPLGMVSDSVTGLGVRLEPESERRLIRIVLVAVLIAQFLFDLRGAAPG